LNHDLLAQLYAWIFVRIVRHSVTIAGFGHDPAQFFADRTQCNRDRGIADSDR